MTDDAHSQGSDASPADTPTPNAAWLDQILWPETPRTDHLKKRGQVPLPGHLIANLVEIEEISILGVPQGATVDHATETGMGVWRLNDDAPTDLLSLVPADGEGGFVGLTVKVVGKEAADGDSVAAMGGVRLEMPAQRNRTLFRHLPDMQWAAARAAEEAAAARAAEEEAAAKAAEEEAAAKAAEEQAAASEPEPEPEPAPEPEAEPDPEPEPPKKSQATIVWNRPEPQEPVSAEPAEEDQPADQAETDDAAPASTASEPEPAIARETEKTVEPGSEPSVDAGVEPAPSEQSAPAASQVSEDEPASEGAEKAEPDSGPPPATAEPDQPRTIDADTIDGTPVAEVDDGAFTGDSDDAMSTGLIRLRLGGAPEVGDPHYRILVDGKQIAAGNIDWVLGMAAADGAADGTCWQDRIIPWNFDNRYPDRVSVRYEIADGAEGALLMEYAEINGLRIDADGPYVFCPEGRIPWAGSGERRSWRGELVVNVAGARAGDPDVTETPTPAQRTGGGESMQRPLIIRPSADDLSNPEIVAGFAVLRRFLRSDGQAGDEDLPSNLADLDLDPTAWNDLVVMGPDGEPVTLEDAGPFDPSVPSTPAGGSGDTPRALVIRPDAEDLSNPHIVAGFRAMRRFLRSHGEAAQDALPLDLRDESLDLGLFNDLVVVGPDGGPADLDAPLAAVARPFVIRPTAEDLANPAVIAELALLRRYLRSDPLEDDPHKPWPAFLGHLGFDRLEWSDVIVIDPSGVVVELGGFDAEEGTETTAFSPEEVEAAMERLVSSDDAIEDEDDAGASDPPQSQTEPVPDGRSIKETFLSAILARMPGRRKNAEDDVVPSEPKTPEDGRTVQQNFLNDAVDRGLTRIEDGFSAEAFLSPSETVDAAPEPDDLSVLELGPEFEMPAPDSEEDADASAEDQTPEEARAETGGSEIPVYLTLDTPLEEPIDEDGEDIPLPPVPKEIPEFLTHLAPAVASIPTKPPEPEPDPMDMPEKAVETAEPIVADAGPIDAEAGPAFGGDVLDDGLDREELSSGELPAFLAAGPDGGDLDDLPDEPAAERPVASGDEEMNGSPAHEIDGDDPSSEVDELLADAALPEVEKELPPLPDPQTLVALNRGEGQAIQRNFLTDHLRSTLENLEVSRRNRKGSPSPISREAGQRISDDFLETVLAEAIAAQDRRGGLHPS